MMITLPSYDTALYGYGDKLKSRRYRTEPHAVLGQQ
jgi:hypothetical protein